MDYATEGHRRPRRSLQLDQLERLSHNPILQSSLYSPYAAQISRRRRSLDATIHSAHPQQHQQQQPQQQQEYLGRPIYVPCRESSVHAHPDAEISQHSSESGDEVCSGQSLVAKTTFKSTLGAATATAAVTTGLQRPQTAAGIINDPFPPEAAYFPARDRGATDYMNVDEPARFGGMVNTPANFGAASPWIFAAAVPAAARADTKARTPPAPGAGGAANRRLRANSATLPAAFGGDLEAAEWVDWSNVDCAFQPDGLMQARAAMIEQCRQNSRRAPLGASVPMMAD
ncbi:unnamed protein product [Closterium sp. NIES-54]